MKRPIPQLSSRRTIIFVQLESERDYPREPLFLRMARARTFEQVRQWAHAVRLERKP